MDDFTTADQAVSYINQFFSLKAIIKAIINQFGKDLIINIIKEEM
jgi:hypothetical protein